MGERLELTTLGGVVILLDGEPVQGLASRKADALLVYLAVTRRAHAREHLATLLWDDRPLGRSLGNLSVLLNSLKKQLAPFLQIGRQNIALDRRSDVRVDLHTLKDALEAVPSKLEARAELEAEALEALERALAVYQGDFLRGFHLRGARGFEEWASVERERTLHLVLVALGDLARTYLRRGDLDPAIRCLQRSLEMDPLQEERHRELMRALALSDRQSEALAQYRRCATVLRAELDVEPSLATRRLHERILVRRDRPLDNLPPIATRTVGRRAELQVIRRRLKDPHTRLLSLVGAGGIGKTRLALEAAARASVSFLEGVWFVDLAPLDDPQHLPQTIGRVLSRPDSPSLATDGGSAADIVGRLLEFLQAKELLLVLDNCEHLLDACAPLCDRLLRHCPGLKVLVTSRERIDLPEEELFQVEPLAIPEAPADAPPDIQTLGENHSIRLFLERARAVRSPFELDARNAEILVGICRSLDGMPLAIELTASRLRSLSLNQISDRLQERKQTVGRDRKGAISRHQTLETAIDWSYNLLNDAEQHLFRLLTIFRGGFDLAALVEVSRSLHLDPGSAEVSLAQLVEKSLVVCRDLEPSQPRYVLLEPVRQFGLQRMQDDPLCERALDAHADYYLRLAERLGPALHGRQRKANIRPLELDADNLRAALR
ncbi:MAG: BTAD domain-containing putative transcriptional regulator, partial [Anaerolineales bacterium]